MKHHIKLFLAGIAAILFGLAIQFGSQSVESITYIDSDFSYANWDDVVLQDLGGRYDYQVGSSGEMGTIMFLEHYIPAPSQTQASGIVVAYINTAFRYNPSTSGALRFLDLEMDGLMMDSSPAPFGDTYFVIRQNGRIYQSQYPMESFNHPLWTRERRTQLVENDFYLYPNGRDEQPDFSREGSPMEFGFLRQSTITTYSSSAEIYQYFGMDNFTVRITEDYIASDLALDPEGNETVYVNLAGRVNSNQLTIGTDTIGRFLLAKNLGPHEALNVRLNFNFSAPSDYIPDPAVIASGQACDPTTFSCYWGRWVSSSSTAWSVEANRTYNILTNWDGYHGSAYFRAYIESDSIDPNQSNNSYSQHYEIFNCPELAGFECPALFLFCDGTFLGPFFDSGTNGQAGKRQFMALGVQQTVSASDIAFNIVTYYQLRDEIMTKRQDGDHFVDLYSEFSLEIVTILSTNSGLYSEALSVLSTWEPTFRSLTQSSGEAMISQNQVDQLEQFLDNLSAAGSPELQAAIINEKARLGGLDQFANQSVAAVANELLGPYQTYIPSIQK